MLLERSCFVEKKIAILGGSTTSEVKNILELFLLNNGIMPIFYESEYNQYFEDALFGNNALKEFQPDIFYIHTTVVNIINFPKSNDSIDDINQLIADELSKYQSIWEALSKYNCAIIQNNFDLPITRTLGNLDCYSPLGKVNFVNKLNEGFSRFAQEIGNLYINDINYLSSYIGLKAWFDEPLWYLSKYALSLEAIPELAFNLSHIINAIFGNSKKCLVLDLDNTCWGGIIGDDGLSGIQIGTETAVAEAFTTFQQYAKNLKDRGVTLAVCSKNNFDNAKEGFDHPESILRFSDFVSFKANWEPKHLNISEIAQEINISNDSLVFIDDNPMEREIVSSQLPSVSVPDVGGDIAHFIKHIERNGYFEVVSLSEEDKKRNAYYKGNEKRLAEQVKFTSYEEFLKSLGMKAIIKPFEDVYLDRITQLSNKTNQFNLTTKRYTTGEITAISSDPDYITLYGKLVDKHGDNGLIAASIGRIREKTCHIDLWLMSCRVLKRGMEQAMLDQFVTICKARGLTEVVGYYFKTKKNEMVSNLYECLGFTLVESNSMKSVWKLDLDQYNAQNIIIGIINE
ncbi:MAG: HAD-IIIC family phosphatase [Oleispira sp.]